MIPPRYFALIPAAGIGARMGGAMPKQYGHVAGKPMLRHVLDTFAACPAITHTFAIVSGADPHVDDMMGCGPSLAGRVTIVRDGGASRRETVLNGLLAMRPQIADDEWVLVHDAARPGLTVAMIDRLLAELSEDPVGGLFAMPVVDTLKRVDDERRAQETVPRDGLWAAQTPQMFRYGLLRKALEQAADVTDEASAIEALGLAPRMVAGSARNIKITHPSDLPLAELYLKGLHD
ncbi:2-C-methyl-D-erythritol 4-phosphate cytidylyltransferase [Noviherbaspirillum pedocola]|uniref:2-C-methyl-D-erythritol 4-phosphate cytidylyltransferase n=1 Tax=Noviherbaspirillum pedocola TaxID=2801341 RepID=A0A934SVP7_9BURK|nr:2-C-methyl-D-erythritol 4-phosphate cytidylyltransferase [Noviherbaspirillum pedocola]MBK4736233.1 2-C-methyl-D-erythritol 4-phosphate cytidylyltransferase [Noviherbaspirillum pedocola]